MAKRPNNSDAHFAFDSYLEKPVDLSQKLDNRPVDYKTFAELLPHVYFPRERDYDEKNDPRISKLSIEGKLNYAKAIAGLDDYTASQRLLDDPSLPIQVPDDHMHERVLIPPMCKSLCIRMADEQIKKFTWKRPYGVQSEDLPYSLVLLRAMDEEDSPEEYGSYADHTIAHFLVKRRGEITLNTHARYVWFSSFVYNKRALIRHGEPYDTTLIEFLQLMESSSRIWCRGIQLDAARGFLYVVLSMDDRSAFYVCVLFLVRDQSGIPEELFTQMTPILINSLEHPEKADQMKLSYVSHAFFTCDCARVTERLTW